MHFPQVLVVFLVLVKSCLSRVFLI